MRVLLAATALMASVAAANAASISTLDEPTIYINLKPSGSEDEIGLGTPPSTFGQSFTVDEKSSLTSFGFEIENVNTAEVVYNAYLYKWDGSHIGDQVADFGLISTSNAPSIEITGLSGLDVVLEAGQYALLYQSVSGGPAGWGATSCSSSTISECSNPYSGGSFLFSTDFNNQNSTNTIQNNFFVSENIDSAFVIELAAVPVGAALPLLATGLLGFGALGLRRRKS